MGQLGDTHRGMGFSPVPHGSPRTRGAVVGGSPRWRLRQCREGHRARPQGRDHLHDVGQHHVRRTECPAPLQRWRLRFLLDVDIRFDWDRFPAAGRVDGDLLMLRTGGSRRAGEVRLGALAAQPPRGGTGPSMDGRTAEVKALTSGCRSGCPACTGPPPAPPAGPSYCRQGEGRVR